LRALLRGRDNTVSAATCLKGQWGTQVRTRAPYWISGSPIPSLSIHANPCAANNMPNCCYCNAECLSSIVILL
jgi:hypothetical protein